MKKVMYRFFIDYQKEEQWLNEQSEKGLHLTKVQFGRYTFIEGTPGEYIYRNELLSGLASKDNNEYLDFLKEGDIEIVNQFAGWGYFRKRANEGLFELYTDASSKVSYLNRLIQIYGFLLLINIFFFYQTFWALDGMRWFSYISLVGTILMIYPLATTYKRKKALQAEQEIFHD